MAIRFGSVSTVHERALGAAAVIREWLRRRCRDGKSNGIRNRRIYMAGIEGAEA
jgi:hypothetical protein